MEECQRPATVEIQVTGDDGAQEKLALCAQDLAGYVVYWENCESLLLDMLGELSSLAELDDDSRIVALYDDLHNEAIGIGLIEGDRKSGEHEAAGDEETAPELPEGEETA